PFAPNLPSMLALQALGGLASGTFYPLSLSYALRSLPPRFTIYGIGAYSMELLSTLSIGTPLQAWFVDHWSWRWIFWTSAALTPVMMLCVWLAVAPAPKREGPAPAGSWRGFGFGSAGVSLLEGALVQGGRVGRVREGNDRGYGGGRRAPRNRHGGAAPARPQPAGEPRHPGEAKHPHPGGRHVHAAVQPPLHPRAHSRLPGRGCGIPAAADRPGAPLGRRAHPGDGLLRGAVERAEQRPPD